jgi:hypothetical protein
VKGRRGRRCEQLRGDLKEKRGYWKLKGETVDRAPWRTGFGRGYDPVVGQIKELVYIRMPARRIMFYRIDGSE